MLAYLASGLLALTPLATVEDLAVPAPTDVTVAWTTPEHTQVVVTWQETGALRNQVDVVNADGSATGWASLIVEADQPNRSGLPGASQGEQLRILVRAIDADGNPTSEPGSSAAFDTDPPPAPDIYEVVPREDGTIAMKWRPGVVRDTTPGDPLDVPAEDPPRFIPVASVLTFNEYDDLSGPSTATSIVVPDRPKPVRVGVRTVPNEWGVNGSSVHVWGTKLTATVPGRATDGAPLRVTGTSVRVLRACDPGPCFTEDHADAARTVQLQARTSETAAWQVVASATTDEDGKFELSVVSPGSRQYRVVAPPVALAGDRDPIVFAATGVTSTQSDPASAGGGGGDDDGLPITGAPAGTAAGVGVALIALGTLLCLAGRRRVSVVPPS